MTSPLFGSAAAKTAGATQATADSTLDLKERILNDDEKQQQEKRQDKQQTAPQTLNEASAGGRRELQFFQIRQKGGYAEVKSTSAPTSAQPQFYLVEASKP